MKLCVVNDNVVIERFQSDEITEGGIVLPDVAKEKQDKGIVRAVGPGKLRGDGTRIPPQVKVGDRVLFEHYAGHDIEQDGIPYTVVQEKDILVVFGE